MHLPNCNILSVQHARLSGPVSRWWAALHLSAQKQHRLDGLYAFALHQNDLSAALIQFFKKENHGCKCLWGPSFLFSLFIFQHHHEIKAFKLKINNKEGKLLFSCVLTDVFVAQAVRLTSFVQSWTETFGIFLLFYVFARL